MKPHQVKDHRPALPVLTPDEKMLVELRDNMWLIDQEQRAATAAFHAAIRIPSSPQFKMQSEWEAFRTRTRNVPPGDGQPNSASEQARKIALLKIARECRAYFVAEVTRLSDRSMEACIAETRQDDVARGQAQYAAHLQQAAPALPRMSPAEFLSQLRARGIGLSIGNDGGLLACPGSLLTEADRGVLREYKAQIATLLTDTVMVA